MNIQAMMKQAQALQKDMMKAKKEIDEKDINVDVVAEEHKNEYHEYTEDLDKDDPVKVTKETKEIRDTSEDAPPNIFSFNFKIA